jgi:hypothetical protein
MAEGMHETTAIPDDWKLNIIREERGLHGEDEGQAQGR